MFKKLSDKFSKGIIYLAAFLVTALMAVMMIHIVKESIPAISQLGIKMFLPTTEWRPVSQKPQYGLLPAIAGTLYVSAIAVVLALIFGVACACFLDYYLPKKVASLFLAFIDLVAGIPSVIFGFIGLTVLVKAFATHLHMAAGQCILAAGIVLGIMLLPFVISTCHESLQTKDLRVQCDHPWILPRIYPAAFYSSGNPAGNHCRCNDGIRPRTWRDNGSHDGNR